MDYNAEVAEAIRRFWLVRGRQQTNQGATSGKRDAGNRSAVTAGKHLDGFIEMLREILTAAGLLDDELHFEVFLEFRQASYAKRYESFCERLLRERWYDGACLILSDQARGLEGGFSEPNRDLGFRVFATSLSAHASAFARLRNG